MGLILPKTTPALLQERPMIMGTGRFLKRSHPFESSDGFVLKALKMLGNQPGKKFLALHPDGCKFASVNNEIRADLNPNHFPRINFSAITTESDGLIAWTLRAATKAEARGSLCWVGPVFALCPAWFRPDGVTQGGPPFILGYSKEWKILNRFGDGGDSVGYFSTSGLKNEGHIKMIAGLCLGAYFMFQYSWTVSLSRDFNGPEISFPTDTHGAREAFKNRDIPDGKMRREAIVQWIAAHWRFVPSGSNDDADETFVREYLRGARNFTCDGLNIRIDISPHDKERVEVLKRQRESLAVRPSRLLINQTPVPMTAREQERIDTQWLTACNQPEQRSLT